MITSVANAPTKAINARKMLVAQTAPTMAVITTQASGYAKDPSIPKT